MWNEVAYAFRGGPDIERVWGGVTSSAEWPEPMALELGDRASMAWFTEMMTRALFGYPYLG